VACIVYPDAMSYTIRLKVGAAGAQVIDTAGELPETVLRISGHRDDANTAVGVAVEGVPGRDVLSAYATAPNLVAAASSPAAATSATD